MCYCKALSLPEDLLDGLLLEEVPSHVLRDLDQRPPVVEIQLPVAIHDGEFVDLKRINRNVYLCLNADNLNSIVGFRVDFPLKILSWSETKLSHVYAD